VDILPSELIVDILDYLDFEFKFLVGSQVCKKWQEAVQLWLRELDFLKAPMLIHSIPTNYLLKWISSCYNLRALNLSWWDKTRDDGLKHLSSLENLMTLDLANCSLITDSSLVVLALHLTNLHSLNLGGCTNITSVGIKCFSSITNLEVSWYTPLKVDIIQCLLEFIPGLVSLNLSYTRTTDQQAEIIGKLTSLTELDLSGCCLTQRGLVPLKNLTQLKMLSLARPFNLKPSQVTGLSIPASLEFLNLSSLRLEKSSNTVDLRKIFASVKNVIITEAPPTRKYYNL